MKYKTRLARAKREHGSVPQWFRDQWRGLRRVAEIARPAPLADFRNYDEYWERRGHLSLVYRRWRIATNCIQAGSTVLDVGCGSGGFLDYLRLHKPSCISMGIDVSENAVNMASAREIRTAIHDIEKDPALGTHDFVTCFEVLEHLPHAELALDAIMNAAQIAAIVSVPNVGFIGCRVRLAFFGRFPTTLCVLHIREHLRFWTVKDFREWVEHYGYAVERQVPQHGIPILAHLWPSLFASGMVYVITKPGIGASGPAADGGGERKDRS